MKGLSKIEIKIVSDLEFRQKYYFTKEDIRQHFSNRKQMTNIIYQLRTKGRIVRLNKDKYLLMPIRARMNKWTDNPLIIADEICNGTDYYIGGWSAANYWGITDQMPMQVDVYTTRRQGKFNILGNRIVFHRIRKKALEKAVTVNISNTPIKMIKKELAKQWMKSRE